MKAPHSPIQEKELTFMSNKIKTSQEDEDNRKFNLSDMFIDLYERCGLDVEKLRQKDTEKKD